MNLEFVVEYKWKVHTYVHTYMENYGSTSDFVEWD